MNGPTPMPESLLCVVGARPNFIKMAPIMAAFAALSPPMRMTLVHTGQHYGDSMNRQFFDALDLPEPDINLAVGSGSHASQTAAVMQGFEPVLDAIAPDAVLVVGDVNSTLACALVASKKGVPVIHVEAGLRSYDRRMPEEINRMLTDQLSDLLFTSESCAATNLLREGVNGKRIHEVGNVMIDSLYRNLERAVPVREQLHALGAGNLLRGCGTYAIVTAHRPSNVDDGASLERLLTLIGAVAQRLPVIFPMHPRTRARMIEFGLEHLLDRPGLLVTAPLGYLEMLGAMKEARVVITDSGGLQEEALVLQIPCITLRDTTERPSTVAYGGNTLTAHDHVRTLAVLDAVLRGEHRPTRRPALWDGHAAARIARLTRNWLSARLARRVAS